jgi:phosphodiester glycosidase
LNRWTGYELNSLFLVVKKIFRAIPLHFEQMSRLAAVVGIVVVLAGCGSKQSSVSYQHEKMANGTNGPWSIHMVKFDRSQRDLELRTTLARETVLGLSTLSEQIQALPREAGSPVAALNGDFYVVEKKDPYLGDPRGLQILDGELVSAPGEQASFWLDATGRPQATNVLSQLKVIWPDGSTTPIGLNEERRNGTAVLYTPRLGKSTRTKGGRELLLERAGAGPWLPLQAGREYTARVREARADGDSLLTNGRLVLSLSASLLTNTPAVPQTEVGAVLRISTATVPDLAGVKAAIGGGYVVVRNGQKQTVQVPKSDAYKYRSNGERHPRSAIGVKGDQIYLVEVDGRQPKLSVGMTLAELGDYMHKLGCDLALSLDGGASATLWFDGKVRNSPCDEAERPIANGLVVLRKNKAK